MPKKNIVTITKLESGFLKPNTLAVVQAYTYNAGFPDFYDPGETPQQLTEIANKGQYFLNVTTGFQATIVVDGVRDQTLTDVEFRGDDVDIPDGSITNAKLADDAVTPTKIADNSIITTKINFQAVQEDDIYPLAVTTNKIADDSVLESKLSAAVRTKLNAVGGGGFDNELLDQTITEDTAIDITGFGYTNAPKVVAQEVSGRGVKITSVTNTTVNVSMDPMGFGSSATFHLYFSTND